MKAMYKNKEVNVWEISRTNLQPDWVKKAFEQKYMVWMDDHIRILMSAVSTSMLKNIQLGVVGTVGGGLAGYDMYSLGYPGDFLDITNHTIVSEKKFHKMYQVIEP